MTPEGRAAALAELAAELFWQDYRGDPTGRGATAILQGNIADAIRAAVAEERERCAKVAETVLVPDFRHDEANSVIAEAIRGEPNFKE